MNVHLCQRSFNSGFPDISFERKEDTKERDGMEKNTAGGKEVEDVWTKMESISQEARSSGNGFVFQREYVAKEREGQPVSESRDL